MNWIFRLSSVVVTESKEGRWAHFSEDVKFVTRGLGLVLGNIEEGGTGTGLRGLERLEIPPIGYSRAGQRWHRIEVKDLPEGVFSGIGVDAGSHFEVLARESGSST